MVQTYHAILLEIPADWRYSLDRRIQSQGDILVRFAENRTPATKPGCGLFLLLSRSQPAAAGTAETYTKHHLG
jgi:hypothetical protein